MTAPPSPVATNRRGRLRLLLIGAGGVCALAFVLVGLPILRARRTVPPPVAGGKSPRPIVAGTHLSVWWDGLPSGVREQCAPTGEVSNIDPSSYVGPEACKNCHQRNYDSWSHHSHRWMNARATPATVKGDFSGKATIAYRGTRGTFGRDGDTFTMHLERGGQRRSYEITQTIGSRYFQYYVGKQTEGPESRDHHFYHKDHVLPFGYWLSQKEWVPTVHIGSEQPDAKRADPFDRPDHGPEYAEYAAGCNYCHTTFPLADMLGRSPRLVGEYAPLKLNWSLSDYLDETHPELVARMSAALERPAPTRGLVEVMGRGAPKNPLTEWEASKHAVTLGVSCEACHLGCKAHVESGGKVLPKFFPSSPHLLVERQATPLQFGRNHDNVNWACGRCHMGRRPQYAAGMATWNSVEYSDAMRGSCYSRLRCIDCHNPHRTIGAKWSQAPDADDASCLKCHEKFRPDEQRVQHTHHPAGSEGGRCMNCHMPRINEGMEGLVRTHMIYSPTRADMIEANHPNACNQCHTDKPIDWTIGHLKDWYGAKFAEEKIAANYPSRSLPAAFGWLNSDTPAVRLVGVDVLTRRGNRQALPQLLDALDDPYLINRQFAGKALQDMLHVRLADLGYHFYMTAEERRRPLADLRARLLRAE